MTIETHDPRSRTLTEWRRASAAGALLLAFAAPAGAGMVPGGGTPASDCYAELDVAGVENGTDSVKKNKVVRCVDGDPCDAGPCGDGVCDFKVRLCWNQNDPNVAACHPMPGLDSLQLRGPLAALVLMPRELGGTTCSETYTDFGVATKLNGKRPGRMNVRIVATAPAGTTPLVDNDLIRLVCVPRPFEECGGAVSTTTTVPATTLPGVTTLPGATTTTPASTSTSTTRRRPRKTTTTVEATTSTSSTAARPTTIPIPTTLPTITLPSTTLPTLPEPTTSTTATPTTSLADTTLVPTTTTPTVEPTTTTERRKHHDGEDLVIAIPLPL
jgi:hypothetical protein